MADSEVTIPYGFCQCGCGEKTKIANKNITARNWIKGQPIKFIHGHNGKGNNSWNWQGGKVLYNGYVFIKNENHPRSQKRSGKYVQEHILVAEKTLGYYLPPKAVVHHINGITTDNRPENLVVCENRAYHLLIHQRERAYKSCGNANWRKCNYCQQYDDPINLFISNHACFHLKCQYDYKKLNK